MTSKTVEIVPPSHRQGNGIPSAAIRWPDFGDWFSFGRPFALIFRHSDTPLLSFSHRRRFSRPTPERVFAVDHRSGPPPGYRRRSGGASNQRICCAIGILEFIHRQHPGGDGLFSPTAVGAVKRQTAIGRAIALRTPARGPALERRMRWLWILIVSPSMILGLPVTSARDGFAGNASATARRIRAARRMRKLNTHLVSPARETR